MANVQIKHNDFNPKLQAAIGDALEAVGIEAVGMINKKMADGYHDIHPQNSDEWDDNPPHTAIRITGDLMRDVHFETNTSEKTVTVGNGLEYAIYVHEGTQKLVGRPYIKDAIQEGSDRLKRIFENYMRKV